MKSAIELTENDEVVFMLANGEQIRLSFTDNMGVEGYGVRVNASKLLAVLPGSGNAVTLTTPKAMAALELKIKEVVARRAKHDDKTTPTQS
jgi:hypothetical protein